ncbi:17225_t:CDS:2 [Dentiscutata erythropus]|uniref:17225_t:CDS:1 n=1 Tax=Dentiscutata erythropus TaxID=1348616 RepID=A0A9N8ZMD3_9GLOM|nr:17225_t:CDS:2 [Dentiscutata erythropus]
MSCHIDMIVRVNQVRLTDREDLNLTIVWATGVYPLESEDRELDLCPLKVSLVSIAQDVMKEFNKESAIVNVLVKDYAGQKKYNFTIKVVFPHQNSRFKHLKSSIWPNESVFFMGQLEVFKGNLYANNFNIFYVDVPFVTKRKVSDSISSESTSGCYSSFRLSKSSADPIIGDNNFLKHERVEDKADSSIEYVGSSVSGCSKHVRVNDEADNYVEYVDSDCSKNKHTFEHNNERVRGSSECGGNIIFEDKEEINYSKKTNKGKGKEI